MKPEWEIKKDKEGNFNGIVAEDVQFVHLERMDVNYFWLGITLQDGSRITANLYAVNDMIKLSAEREKP